MYSSAETAFDRLYELLPERLSAIADLDGCDFPNDVHTASIIVDEGTLDMSFGPGETVVFVYDVPGFGTERIETTLGDHAAEILFKDAADALVTLMPTPDPWECEGEFGYADQRIIGTETWEDQAGMEDLKKTLKVPSDWFLVKIVNYGSPGRRLADFDEWLAEYATDEYRRVGWTTSCTTKVGVAFKLGADAVYFKMRWR